MKRTGFIGGSDMRRIMDGDWYTLWQEKTSRILPKDLSDVLAVQLGVHTEQFNIDWFEKQYDLPVYEQQKEFRMNWNGVPLKGTVDGIVDGNILECKHTYDHNNIDNVIKTYMPQLQFYMWLAMKDGCYLSVIFGNRRWVCTHVAKDWDYIHKMQVHLEEFWKNVSKDEWLGEPVLDKPNIEGIAVDHMVRRDASSDNEFVSRCHDYIDNIQAAKDFESAKDDLKLMVAPNEREVYTDMLTVKRDKRGSLRITIKENNND